MLPKAAVKSLILQTEVVLGVQNAHNIFLPLPAYRIVGMSVFVDDLLPFFHVILKGETGHQDSELRTEYFLQALAENGVRIERLGEESANWQRGEAREIMTEFLLSSDGIEAVFSNNDMMALGAIDALKEAGWFDDGPYMPVIGCDGIEEAIQAMEDGYLLYTVKNDAENQARVAYRIASLLAEDEVPDEDSIGYEMDGRYVWIPYQEIVL